MSDEQESVEDIINETYDDGYLGKHRATMIRADRIRDAVHREDDAKLPRGSSYWYCPECHEEVTNERVTFNELHDVCGHPVKVVTPRVQDDSVAVDPTSKARPRRGS